jgi:hypothetical protein
MGVNLVQYFSGDITGKKNSIILGSHLPKLFTVFCFMISISSDDQSHIGINMAKGSNQVVQTFFRYESGNTKNIFSRYQPYLFESIILLVGLANSTPLGIVWAIRWQLLRMISLISFEMEIISWVKLPPILMPIYRTCPTYVFYSQGHGGLE